jgi:AcrR family transcriptional regulator
MAERTGDTRSRIRAVALELFTEQGYEQTSLREIAERLGVTKAALYYHFKSKDEIVSSFLDDRIAMIDELIAWAAGQPPGPETRREIIRRYAEDVCDERNRPIMRFFEHNQATLKGMAAGQGIRERVIRLVHTLAGPQVAPADRLRAAMALFAVQSSSFVLNDPDVTDDERHDAALEVAYEMLEKMDVSAGRAASPAA